MFILGIPIFDTLFVMYIRYRRGLPIFWGSPDHVAIRLRHLGMSVQQIVITSYMATAVVGGIGLVMLSVGQDIAWVLCAGTAGALLCVTAMLGKIDVSRPEATVVASSQGGGTKAA